VIDPAKREAFLRDLHELTQMHGIAIGGCGCCGSPYLYEVNPSECTHYVTGDRAHAENHEELTLMNGERFAERDRNAS
jgi:hypothetical protein